MGIRNLTDDVLSVDCRMVVAEDYTIVAQPLRIAGNETATVTGCFGSHIDGGYMVVGSVNLNVWEYLLCRSDNYMRREFDITHTSSRERPADSTLPHVRFRQG